MDSEQFWFFLMWAAIVMFVGIVFIIHERTTRREVTRLGRVGRRASAVVVDYEYRRDLDGDPVPYPLVRFQTPDGHLVRATTDLGGSLVPGIGDQVDVLYDPQRPEEAHLDSELSDQLTSLAGRIGRGLIVVGMLTVVIALLIFWPVAGVVVLMVGGVVLTIVIAARRIPAHRPSPHACHPGERVVAGGRTRGVVPRSEQATRASILGWAALDRARLQPRGPIG